jgi:MFS transporter, UMF1 family
MKARQRDRFTRAEKSWITYDWANSAYTTIIIAAIFPIYFSGIAAKAGVPGDIWWGYATSLATLVAALLAPVLGAIGDFHGMKKKLLGAFLIFGLIFTITMALTDRWQMMLIGYVISYIGYSGSLLFYDSFLTDVTSPERMDKVSAWGYSMGYIGGSTIPFILSIVLLLAGKSVGIGNVLAVKISVLLCAAWWAVFSVPILRDVRQVHYVDKPAGALIKGSLNNIRRSLVEIAHNKAVFYFMLAYFFYIDGVNTVIHMATVYGSSLGLGSTGMILALLVTQIVAVPFSILFSKFSARIGSIRMISIAIIVYFVICTLGFYMGYSLEPSQNAYKNSFNTRLEAAGAQYQPAGLDAADRQVYEAQIGQLKTEGDGILANSSRADDFDSLVKDAADKTASLYSSTSVRTAVGQSLASIALDVKPFLQDAGAVAAFASALKRAAMLFWILAILVGTCQGGIQALSRSFFGKLIPADRSNEYFGFFDIFGKFAAVLGPGLYSLTANLTGRSSFGILSLMLLFAVGLTTILVNRRRLRQAEETAMETSRAAREAQDTLPS